MKYNLQVLCQLCSQFEFRPISNGADPDVGGAEDAPAEGAEAEKATEESSESVFLSRRLWRRRRAETVIQFHRSPLSPFQCLYPEITRRRIPVARDSLLDQMETYFGLQ